MPSMISNNLLLYMTFAYGAYRPRPKVNAVENYIEAEFVRRVATTKAAVDAFVIEGTREAVLAFRGSSRWAHWHSNLKADWVDHFSRGEPAGRVHRGFQEGKDAILPHCQDLLAECVDRCGDLTRITLAGHSRGGAICELVGPSLELGAIPTAIQIYTFGSPRVGEWQYARAFSASGVLHWRCEILGDPIPVVGFLGKHTGHLARIEPGSPHQLVLVRREESPLRRLVTTAFKPIDIIEKHAAKNYLSTIRELYQGTLESSKTLRKS